MKKLLSLLLCMVLLCGVLPVSAEEADPNHLYPTAPMRITEYMTYHAQTMRTISPDYRASLYLIKGHNGSYVLSDGSSKDGVVIFEWRVRGDQIVGITVSYPNDADHLEQSAEMWSIWSIFALMPFALRDGLSYDEAYERCHHDFYAMMRSDGEITSIYGIQAQLSRDANANHMHYTIHGGITPPAAETPALDLPGFAAYKAAATEALGIILPEAPVWTNPAQGSDGLVIGIKALGDNPLVMYREDEILVLMISVPLNEENPQDTLSTVRALSHGCIFAPLLMAHGMTYEEASAASEKWIADTSFSYALIGAMCGEPIALDFYGTPVTLGMTESGGQQLLIAYISTGTGK